MRAEKSESSIQESVNELISQKKKILPKPPQVGTAIRKKFSDLGMEVSADNPLPTDLGDIFTIALTYTRIIEKLLKTKGKNDKEVILMLRLLEKELYIHLPYHLKSLKKPLRRLIDGLTE